MKLNVIIASGYWKKVKPEPNLYQILKLLKPSLNHLHFKRKERDKWKSFSRNKKKFEI